MLFRSFFFNAVVSNAYMAAVACGQPNLPLKVNLFALVVYLPALYWLTRLYGISGAAAAYAGLNAYYVFSLVPLVQARVIGQGFGVWLRENLLPFLFAGLVVFGFARLFEIVVQPSWPTGVLIIFASIAYLTVAWFFLSSALRADLANLRRRLVRR